MQAGNRLDPHQRRRDQLEPAKSLEPDGISRRCDRDACVNEELQRPCRESATAATQFGAGEPSSSVCHSGGSGSIGYISSRTSSSAPGSINRLPWLVVAGRRPSRTQRRTVPGLLPTLCAASVTVSMTRCYAFAPTGRRIKVPADRSAPRESPPAKGSPAKTRPKRPQIGAKCLPLLITAYPANHQ